MHMHTCVYIWPYYRWCTLILSVAFWPSPFHSTPLKKIHNNSLNWFWSWLSVWKKAVDFWCLIPVLSLSLFFFFVGQAYPFHFVEPSLGVWFMSSEPFQSLISKVECFSVPTPNTSHKVRPTVVHHDFPAISEGGTEMESFCNVQW